MSKSKHSGSPTASISPTARLGSAVRLPTTDPPTAHPTSSTGQYKDNPDLSQGASCSYELAELGLLGPLSQGRTRDHSERSTVVWDVNRRLSSTLLFLLSALRCARRRGFVLIRLVLRHDLDCNQIRIQIRIQNKKKNKEKQEIK